MSVLLYLAIIGIYFLYKWSIATYDFFEKQGIRSRKPLPLFGSQLFFIIRVKSIIDIVTEWYNEFQDEKVSGIFELRRPVALIRDPKIAKLLAVKDFDHFMDHRSVISEDVDPMFGKILSF